MRETVQNVRNALVAVGTADVLVSPSHERSEIVISNTSTAAQNITLRIGAGTAVAYYGIFLLPYSVWFSSDSQGFKTTNSEIHAIGSAVSGQLSVFER